MSETGTETPVEVTPTLDLDSYASTGGDAFVGAIYPMVKGNLGKLESIAAQLKKYSPPNQVDVYNHIKANPKGNESLSLISEKVAELEKQVAALRTKANEIARDELQPEKMDEKELASLKTDFDSTRETVKGQLTSVGTYLDTMGKADVKAAFEALKVPQFRTGSSSAVSTAPSEATKVREWAKENGIEVNERGRIAADVQAKYDAAHAGS